MNEMQWIVAKSLKYRYLVVFGAALLMIFGISQIRSMSVDVFLSLPRRGWRFKPRLWGSPPPKWNR